MYVVVFPVQIRFQSIPNCTCWTEIGSTAKLMIISKELTDYIRNQCECGFSSSHIHQPNFRCFVNSPNHVTFRASLIAFSSYWSTDQLVNIVEDWITSRMSIAIQGKLLNVDRDCVIVIPSLDSPECTLPVPSSSSLTFIITGFAVFIVMIITTLILVPCIVAVKKYRRYSFMHFLLDKEIMNYMSDYVNMTC